jgi:hypothetical protein
VLEHKNKKIQHSMRHQRLAQSISSVIRPPQQPIPDIIGGSRHQSPLSLSQQPTGLARKLTLTPKAGPTRTLRRTWTAATAIAAAKQYALLPLPRESIFRAKDRTGFVAMDNQDGKQSHLCVLIHGYVFLLFPIEFWPDLASCGSK